VKFVSRKAWGARTPRGRTPIPGGVTGIALHYEGPKTGTFPHSECDNRVRSIQRFHMDNRGWDDIAYTALVCPHGYVYEGRGPGVRTAAQGTNYGNDEFYAVCWLGGEGDPFGAASKQGFLDAIAWLRSRGAGRAVKPHSAFHSTGCPGAPIRNWISAGLPKPTTPAPAPQPKPTPTPTPAPTPPQEDKMYFLVADPDGSGSDYGTDGVTKFSFPSQAVKNEWAERFGAKRITLSKATLDAIPTVKTQS
jgi:hypothetical protein